MRDDQAGWIYFILSMEQDAVKIGFAENINSRMAMLQTGNPYDLQLFDCFRGTRRLEKALHQKFKRYRIKREWFRHRWRIDAFLDELYDLREERVLEMYLDGEFEGAPPEEIIAALSDVLLPEKAILAIDVESEPGCPCAIDDECQGTCEDFEIEDFPSPSLVSAENQSACTARWNGALSVRWPRWGESRDE